MAQPLDTSAIRRLVARARLRIRVQWAFEGAATATIIAAALAMAAIVGMRAELVAHATGVYLLIGCGLVVAAGAAISAARRLDDETVARRLDRASNLADRLSTAIAFERALASGGPADLAVQAEPGPLQLGVDTTHELMLAAIRDGVRSAPRANLEAAAPFTAPKDLRPAGGFVALCAIIAGLALPTTDRSPRLVRATPDHAPAGTEVQLAGERLTTTGFAPAGASISLGTLASSRPVAIVAWTTQRIDVRIPDDAPLGDMKLIAFANGERIGIVDFTVVDKKDVRYHKDDTVALDTDEKAYVETILAELRNVAQRDKVPELDEFANKIEKLLDQAEKGEISKEQLLDALSKAEDALNKEAEPNPQEVAQKLAEMGKELAKNQQTKDLGEALQKQDLEKAQKELEKLADKLDKKELNEQQKQDLAKKLDQVAKEMEKKDQQEQKKTDDRQQKMEEEIRRLEKQKQEAKNDKQREELERRLEDKQRELKKLQKEEQQKQESEQRRAVKRLQKDMEKAAENLQKPQKDPNSNDKDQDKEQEEREHQASQKLKEAARETGRVDKDQRKQATQKKMSSQMDDLREAMRRAKQKGSKGPQDPFNKNNKNQDFAQRARGQKSGQGQSWRPGQGQGQGQGSGQGSGQNGQGQQNGGSEWGTGHDDNLQGDPTQISGNDKDVDVQGRQSKEGSSTRETILAASQKGFANAHYAKVFADYQRIVEEVMRTEKLPSSYKYYVKRYFAKIHPSMTPSTTVDQTAPPPGGAAGRGAAPTVEDKPQ
jgi:hypothetical protein